MKFFTKESPELDSMSDEDRRNLLGGKGAGLVWMSKAGVNVPPFVVIPTTVYTQYKIDPASTMAHIKDVLPTITEYLRKHFGYVPLVSVRSGARVSCPGMMDTILNVGMVPENEDFWREKLGDSCYSDSLHRLITMYGNVVHGLDRHELEKDDVLSAISYYARKVGDFPDVEGQLLGAIEAVFKSWDNDRAKTYRKLNNIPDEWGTAVTIQSMVFGNLNDNSGTGVLFTRNPDTGDKVIMGEYLMNAQGEDVVAGIRTPMPLIEMSSANPDMYNQIAKAVLSLEKAAKDVQDVEFTIQDGELFILQTRNAKRSDKAAVRIALDMHGEGVLDEAAFLKRITPKALQGACLPVVDPNWTQEPILVGIPACSGVVTGLVVHKSEDAVAAAKEGKKVILVTKETTPDDIAGMHAAEGVLTMTGGATSHAAVVARSMNRACVVGAGKDLTGPFAEGKTISICGATGRVWSGQAKVISGSTELAARTLRLLLNGSLPIVSTPDNLAVPKGTSFVLDISDKLHWSETSLTHLLGEAQGVAGAAEWYVSLYAGMSEDELRPLKGYNQLFMSAKKVDGAAKHVQNFLIELRKSKNLKMKIISPVSGADIHVGPTPDLESLVMTPKNGSVVISGSGKGQSEAVKKVLAWLEKDGVKFTSFNLSESSQFIAPSRLMAEKMGK